MVDKNLKKRQISEDFDEEKERNRRRIKEDNNNNQRAPPIKIERTSTKKEKFSDNMCSTDKGNNPSTAKIKPLNGKHNKKTLLFFYINNNFSFSYFKCFFF